MKNKPKVLFVYTYRVGGISTALERYKKVLEELHYSVEEVGAIADRKVTESSSRHVIYELEKDGFLGTLKSNFKLAKKITSLKKIKKYDVVQVNTIWKLLTVNFVFLFSNVKIVYFFHGLESQERKSAEAYKTYYDFFTQLLEKMLALLCDQVVCFSHYSKQLLIKTAPTFLKGKLENQILLLPFFTDASYQKQNIKTSDDELCLVNFGRPEPRKGLDVLLHAAQLLKKRNISFKLYIAGPFEYHFHTNFKLLRLYEELDLFDRVHFIHAVDTQQKRLLLEKADLFIMPSRDLETFGITVFEALEAGVPVIASSRGALKENLSKIDPNFLFTPYTSQALADKIEWFSKLSPLQRKKTTTNLLKKFDEVFSVKNQLPSIEKVFTPKSHQRQ